MKRLRQILFWTCISLLLGRAWQHLFWDAPYRSLLWDEQLLSIFFPDWPSYLKVMNDSLIQAIIKSIGVFFLGTAMSLVFKKKFIALLLKIAGVLILILSLLYWKDKFWRFGELIEYSVQMITLFASASILIKNVKWDTWIFPFKIAISLTFIGHGIYAIGWHPQPGYFIDMCINVFQFSEPTSVLFLKIMGVLDFIFAIGIFVPWLEKWSLYYMIIWGIATTLSRLLAHLSVSTFLNDLNQWGFEVLVRFPHFTIPIILLMWFKINKDN